MINPITPPPELVEQWEAETAHTTKDEIWHVAVQAAQWGANQELEACCKEMKSLPSPLGIPFGEMASNALRASRRPNLPTLKEQAFRELGDAYDKDKLDDTTYDTIRRALEALDD